MENKQLIDLLRPKGKYTETDLSVYTELTSGKVRAALLSGFLVHLIPLFNLIEDKDSAVGSDLEQRYSNLENKKFSHEAGENFDDSIEDIIQTSLDARVFGIGIVELYIDNDGNFAYRRIEREYISFDEKGVYLKSNKRKIRPTEPKFIVFRQKPVLKKLLWIVFAKHFVLSHYMKFTELMAIPPLIGQAAASDPKAIDAMAEAFGTLRSGSYAVFGKDDIVKLLEGKGSQADFMEFVRYADGEIGRVINGANLQSQSAKSGSYAQAKVHQSTAANITKRDVRFATRVVKHCFSIINIKPKLNIHIEKSEDLEKKINVYKGAKELGHAVAPEDLVSEFDLTPHRPTDIAPVNRAFEPNSKLAGDNADAFLNSKSFKEASLKTEKEILAAVEEISKECNSYEEILTRLKDGFPNAPLESLENVMGNVIANAGIFGSAEE